MGHEEHGGTWRMEAAQLDTQRKKGEAILKTSSTVYSTNRSSSSTRPAKLQLDRAGSQSQTRKMPWSDRSGRSWPDGCVVGRCGRTDEDLAEEISRPDARRSSPGRDLGAAELFWTLAETSDGRTRFWPSAVLSFLGQPDWAVWALILDRAVWSSLHSFGCNSVSTHPN
ncbi:unnamed protein product [Microthlaspi erraticum]|uniref:Uncharacterized protein n=1 Tax=Microthlaspi erraticum TaxID=1685480 RepID=A0A6D2I871_9BRAS|nr:unnamed protein product [Microthlaspi erraticum]